MRAKRYHLDIGDGKTYGPFAAEQIEGMWSSGQITDDARVIAEGGRKWEHVGVALKALDRQRRPFWSWKFLTSLTMAAVTGLLIAVVLANPSQPEDSVLFQQEKAASVALNRRLAVKAWMKTNFPDPEAELLDDPVMTTEWGVPLLMARVRGRNAFGGYVIQEYAFLWNGDKVVAGEAKEVAIEEIKKAAREKSDEKDRERRLKELHDKFLEPKPR
ncbi:GYF domain-containing protein [Verrucomicrobium sp. BvORR034]|jgi:hypothetical protein|uniref:GYF domain-containing protein n=1 Tax=Verrucomicrobium sp. BvORR034 TaxID=1396418 RepID=UPI000678FF73|nr:GYF domain-containing protein [Verrucomicrobium sp. BvORR034]